MAFEWLSSGASSNHLYQRQLSAVESRLRRVEAKLDRLLSHHNVSFVPNEFDVVLTGFGNKKLNVVKVIKNITGASLMDAKMLVESAPTTIKVGATEDEATSLQAEIEEAGGTVVLDPK
jgi:ribosomal protein L7/L12